ncbi:MAG TPA: retroviral-like aspartic protease family protein, partial [Planctomycetota bacterium]|nr:retroviral-like aspartic protease family protein [Planctomycetota bacterium]
MHARTRSGPGWVAMFVVCAAGCASGIAPATVPMDRSFRVDATIDSQPVRVMLDTGSTRSSLKREVADRLGLGLRPEPRATVTDATGAKRPIDGMVLLPGLRIGETTWAAFEACCHAMHSLPGEGLIGMEVLGSAVWWFDAPARVVHMLRPEDVREALAARGHRVLAKLPLGDNHSRPFVQVRLENRADVELLVDTGADRTSLPADVAARLALPSGQELARQQAAQEQARIMAEMERQVDQGIDEKVRSELLDEFIKAHEPSDAPSIGVHGVAEQRTLLHLRLLELGGMRFRDLVVTDA